MTPGEPLTWRLSKYAKYWGCDLNQLALLIATDPEWPTFIRPEDTGWPDTPSMWGWPDYRFTVAYLDVWREHRDSLIAAGLMQERTKK